MRTVAQSASFSELATLAACGEQYRRRYMDREHNDERGAAELVGSAFHDAAEKMEREFIEVKGDADWWTAEATTERLKVLTRRLILADLHTNNLDPDELRVWGKQTLDVYRTKHLLDFVRNYTEQRALETARGVQFATDNGEPLAELDLEWPLFDGQLVLRGTIDAVMIDSIGRLFIRDLKTGKVKDTHAIQLEIYRYLLTKCTGGDLDPVYGHGFYVKGSASKFQQVFPWEMSDGQVEEMVGRLWYSTEKGVAVNGPFNGECGICDYQPTCAWGNLGFRGSN